MWNITSQVLTETLHQMEANLKNTDTHNYLFIYLCQLSFFPCYACASLCTRDKLSLFYTTLYHNIWLFQHQKQYKIILIRYLMCLISTLKNILRWKILLKFINFPLICLTHFFSLFITIYTTKNSIFHLILVVIINK